MTDIGERIRALRLEHSMTMDELAKLVGYNSRASISRVEHGETDLPLSKVSDFARALDTTPAYLMGWTDDPAEEEYDYDLDPEGRLADLDSAVWDEFKRQYPTISEAYRHYKEFEEARLKDAQGARLQDVYLNFAKEAQSEGIDPDDIRAVLDILKRTRNHD